MALIGHDHLVGFFSEQYFFYFFNFLIFIFYFMFFYFWYFDFFWLAVIGHHIFSNKLKIARVTRLFKPGDAENVTNYPANICWTLRRLEDVFKIRLQRNNFLSSWRLANASWRHLANTSWIRLEDISQDVLKTSWRHLLKTSWR